MVEYTGSRIGPALRSGQSASASKLSASGLCARSPLCKAACGAMMEVQRTQEYLYEVLSASPEIGKGTSDWES